MLPSMVLRKAPDADNFEQWLSFEVVWAPDLDSRHW